MKHFFGYLPGYRIAICGLGGAGTTSLAVEIHRNFKITHVQDMWSSYSAGDAFRDIAAKAFPGIPGDEALAKLVKSTPEGLDEGLDMHIAETSRAKNCIIWDARLGARNMPADTFRIFLWCSPEVAIERIYRRELLKNKETTKAQIAAKYHARVVADNERYKKIYGVESIGTQVDAWHMTVNTGEVDTPGNFVNTPGVIHQRFSGLWAQHVRSLNSK